MNIREFSKPISSKQLNEGLAKQFGYKLNLEQFSDVQLEDARNKLRTKISQFEVNESYDGLQESPEYQKTRMFLDTINQEIMEREEGKCSDCHKDPCECDDEDDHDHNNRKDESRMELRKKLQAESIKQRAQQYSVPTSWINSAIQRIELSESDEEELAAELTLRYDLSEAQANHVVYLSESESDKAEIIMATKDIVDRITGWLEDTAAMKAEQLLELTDSIRETLGSDVAQQYTDAVKPPLEAIYTALETSRQGLQGALALVSGEEAPTMGSSPMGMTPPLPSMGAAPMGGSPAAGGEEELGAGTPPAAEAGREKRESVDYSRRLATILTSKKK
jgi:hypothetical protein